MPAYFIVCADDSGDIDVVKVLPGAVVPKEGQSVPREYVGDEYDDCTIILVFEEGTSAAKLCQFFEYLGELEGLSGWGLESLAEFTRAVWKSAVAFQKR